METQGESRWLFQVEDVFSLSGLGFVVVGGLRRADEILSVGETLTFICLGGQVVNTQIKSFPMINPRRSQELIALEVVKTKETKHITAGAQVLRQRPHR